MDAGDLTIREAQACQPWAVRYNDDFANAASSREGTSHLMASHAVLHAAKSVGKLSAVFEALDHTGGPIAEDQINIVADMAADLITAALRLGNLYGLDVAERFVERVNEKNGADLLGDVARHRARPDDVRGELERRTDLAENVIQERAQAKPADVPGFNHRILLALMSMVEASRDVLRLKGGTQEAAPVPGADVRGERAALDAQMLRAEMLVAARMEAAGQGRADLLSKLEGSQADALMGLVPAVRSYLMATDSKGD